MLALTRPDVRANVPLKLAVHGRGLRQVVKCIKKAVSLEGFRYHPAIHLTISDSLLLTRPEQPSSFHSSSACVTIKTPCLLGIWHTQPKMPIAMGKELVPTHQRSSCASIRPRGPSCLNLLRRSRIGNRTGPRDGVHTQLCL